MAPDLERARAIFLEAVGKRPADQWDAYVAEACGGDVGLAERVRHLLRAHADAGSFLEGPAANLNATVDQPSGAESPGTVIGPYKLLEQIGEGGFGVVFLAEQTEPVRRKVALKVLKAGMDTRQVVARFEAERQALAIMDHPNIAKVHDGGVTPSGRPYFVMELVKGTPITEYCDQNHLTPRQRLDLFVPVCHAVQHAHQKGIIHRDLKPSNVLVSRHDATPVVKVIDFGVAKALGQSLTDKTLFTGIAQMIGTPLYMSPEQAGMSDLDVDTRSDIYSLGVLLYELLTGTTPFTRERFRTAAYDEIRRIIREEDPPKPSTRLSESKDTLSSISAQRHTEPAKLTRLVRGELDWIVMKALEKDRSRRYETANGFAADVQRYLAGEAVQAVPPSAAYRLKKFVRRNRGPVLAVGLVLLALVAGIVGTTWQAIRASDRAEGERQARERAEANFALADEAVGTYLGTVTDDPDLKQPDFNRLRKKLLEGAVPFFQKIVAQKGDDPAIEAERGLAYLRLARLRLGLEEDRAALQDAEAMHEIFARLAADSPKRAHRHGLANSLHTRAVAMERLRRLAEAEAGFRRAIDLLDALVAESPTDPRAREDLAHVHNDLGFLLYRASRLREGEPVLRRAADLLEELAAAFTEVPAYRRKLADSQSRLGGLLADLGEFEKGAAAIRRALDVQGKLVAAFPHELDDRKALATQWNELGRVHHLQGDSAKAEEAQREALGIREKLAAALPDVVRYRRDLADSHHNLSVALDLQGKLPEAETVVRKGLDIREKFAAALPTSTASYYLVTSYIVLGNVLTRQNKLPEAKTAFLKAVEINEKLVAGSPGVAGYEVLLGGVYCNLGNLSGQSGELGPSLEWFDKAVVRLEAVLAHERRMVTARQFLGNAVGGRADTFDALGRHDDAVADRKRALELDDGRARDQLRAKLVFSRLRAARKDRDAAGCLAAASEYETLIPTDPVWLYEAARARSICAAVIPLSPKTPPTDAARLAKEQADRAMAWLRKAVAAGYTHSEYMERDKDLDALSGRDDFKKLLAELEAKKK